MKRYYDFFADGFRKPMLTTYSEAMRLAKTLARTHTNGRLDVWNSQAMQYDTIWKQPNKNN